MRMRPKVHTEKHMIPTSPFNVAAAAIVGHTFVESVAVVDKNANTEVEEGSTISAVYLEFWITADDTNVTNFQCTVEKLPSGRANMLIGESQALNDYTNKKNILWTSQGLLGGNGNNAIPVIRQWVKIPRGKQRMGLGDKLRINFAAGINGLEVCGMTIYKEQK